MIISLYAGEMTIRDIQHHLATTIGTELSHETISNITDAVLEAVLEWQQQPLDDFYPVVHLDAIRVKVRDVLIVCCDGLTGLPEAIEAT
ncbi:Transposase, Mutator family [Brevibacterium jeotgali]|uniref:Mutator family transposase n=1 Tax=Brevibacterium jeotgali TaxID=1262550 RepID=A0A2H1L5M3_9MICO|nr:Transposase, Mutator family [Brevibacterium jeotgali]